MYQGSPVSQVNSMLIRLGAGHYRLIYGGPYLARFAGSYGVKLAPEVYGEANCLLPIRDFSTPDSSFQVRWALAKTLWQLMHRSRAVYVGCRGGQGRTGLFLSLLMKVVDDYGDPVRYVRGNYSKHAVETAAQEAYVDQFRVGWVRWYAKGLLWWVAHDKFDIF